MSPTPESVGRSAWNASEVCAKPTISPYIFVILRFTADYSDSNKIIAPPSESTVPCRSLSKGLQASSGF